MKSKKGVIMAWPKDGRDELRVQVDMARDELKVRGAVAALMDRVFELEDRVEKKLKAKPRPSRKKAASKAK